MTKQEIVTTVYEKLGFSKRESSEIVEHFFSIIKSNLAEGRNVKISGLGNFVVRDKKARKGRNPQTGEEIQITPRRVLNFRLSQVLKDEINDDGHNHNNSNNGR
jgi:integration host factor subunit alpha